MLGIIIGLAVLVAIVVAVICSIARTPDHLQGYYGGMFWTIAIIAIVGVITLTGLGLI